MNSIANNFMFSENNSRVRKEQLVVVNEVIIIGITEAEQQLRQIIIEIFYFPQLSSYHYTFKITYYTYVLIRNYSLVTGPYNIYCQYKTGAYVYHRISIHLYYLNRVSPFLFGND